MITWVPIIQISNTRRRAWSWCRDILHWHWSYLHHTYRIPWIVIVSSRNRTWIGSTCSRCCPIRYIFCIFHFQCLYFMWHSCTDWFIVCIDSIIILFISKVSIFLSCFKIKLNFSRPTAEPGKILQVLRYICLESSTWSMKGGGTTLIGPHLPRYWVIINLHN